MNRRQSGLLMALFLALLLGVVFWWMGTHDTANRGVTETQSRLVSAFRGFRKTPARERQPLPELVPGSPLTDQRFADISAKIMVAILGIKRDGNWRANVARSMDKILGEEDLAENDFEAYALALNKNPDRKRAVADNIVDLAQKKLGRHFTPEEAALLKLDQVAAKNPVPK